MNKTYPVYNFDFFDESIEENNSAFSVLSKKSKIEADEESRREKSSMDYCWFSGTSQMTIDELIKHAWSKEDVDNFVDEYPECSTKLFIVYDESHQHSFFNYIKYCPLQERRDNLINQILK